MTFLLKAKFFGRVIRLLLVVILFLFISGPGCGGSSGYNPSGSSDEGQEESAPADPSASAPSYTFGNGLYDGTLSGNGGSPCVDPSTGRSLPLASASVATTANGGVNSGRFGNTRNGGTRRHGGIDLAAEIGTPVYAICDGVVNSDHYLTTARDGDTAAGGSYGNMIAYTGVINGESVTVLNAHLSRIDTPLVKPGDIVRRGQLIGYTGQTGNAYGSAVPNKHLHLEIRKDGKAVNPEPYLNGYVSENGTFAGIKCN